MLIVCSDKRERENNFKAISILWGMINAQVLISRGTDSRGAGKQRLNHVTAKTVIVSCLFTGVTSTRNRMHNQAQEDYTEILAKRGKKTSSARQATRIARASGVRRGITRQVNDVIACQPPQSDGE